MADINLAAVIKNITIEQGTTVEIPFAVTRASVAVDLTGYLLRLQVRRRLSDTVVLINCTQANGKLVWVDQVAGEFKLLLTPADTNASNGKIRFGLEEDVLDCVYDLELESAAGVVFKGCRGAFEILREVTR